MRAIVLLLAAAGAGWAAVHQTMTWLGPGPGAAHAPLLLGLVVISAGLLGAFIGVTVAGLLLPAAR